MSAIIEGSYKSNKHNLILDGKNVIVQKISCYHYDENTNTSFTYVKEVVYKFDTEEKAKEYYYKMK